jgi:Ni/Fe-hydrogenase subunit HybB-like protein
MKAERRISRFTLWMAALATVMAIGLVAAGIVFTKGLVVTNLTDLVPWGLWITIDLSSIALSAGAFTLSAAVYLLGLKHLQKVARTAVFIGLIGYSMALLTLMVDIGRPDRFWHALVFWNPHSLLWEVSMCITLYLGVLSLEAAPIVANAAWLRERLPKVAERLESVHRLAPVLAVAGLGLSMLHQSSLGATYGVLKARPIWLRPGLSVLFIVSAIVAGSAFTIFASMLAARLTPRAKVDDKLLSQMSKFVGWALVFYLYFRFWDTFAITYTYQPGQTEGLHLLTRGPLAVNFWLGEILLGAVAPAIVLLKDSLRRKPILRMMALALVALGIVAHRWDTTMVGQMVVLTYLPQEIVARYTSYMPSLIEILTGAGIAAYGLTAFTLGVRYLKVVDHTQSAEHEPELARSPGVSWMGAD